MAWKSTSDHQHAVHLNPDSVNFSMFTEDDVLKLSVMKICTPLSFDSLGFPLAGGLHDLGLGPVSDKGDACTTCSKGTLLCPGHFGHIELPLPVVNPIFHKVIATIIKMSCLKCFRMQVPEHIKHVLSIQMQLLDQGQVAEAVDVYNRIVDLVTKFEKFENIPEDELVSLKSKQLQTVTNSESIKWNNKNTESLRNDFISNIFNNTKRSNLCIHCKASIKKVTTLKNKLFIAPGHTVDPDNITVRGSHYTKHISPNESRQYLQSLWENEKELLLHYIPVLKTVKCQYPTDVLYLNVVPVTPNNVRPVNIMNGRMTENPNTKLYKTILQDSILLRTVIQVLKEDEDVDSLPDEAKMAYMTMRGNNAIEKLNYAWESLQNSVDYLVDMDIRNSELQGLKQLIEKKTGIIRKHMMGKRVNFAARSVITPDPNLNIDEIGVPEEFAKHLTYPVPVTSWNVEDMRKLILNGPYVHPGAVSVEYEDGTVKRINPTQPVQVQSILKRLLTPDDQGFQGVKLVNRHLCNGDILLLNRQPTLHRPSIMAHKARVLKGEKTLRLHYANCKAYNADFDGDEMNAHFPQNELSRSEAYNIANVANQYLVPKDGTPLSGLIQDHMISGVKLSIRGKFFSKNDYQQLVYQAVSFKHSHIKLLPPTIIKPQLLWSGKQILSTVILNIIPKGKNPINLTATSKISANAWINDKPRTWKAGGTSFVNPNYMTEAEVIIRQGELLCGILDKSHYGATPYGLVHCMYELYGGDCSIKLLSSFAKLFTCFLQMEGFTLGVHDILVLSEADKKRDGIIKNSRKIGAEVMTTALNIPNNCSSEIIVEKLEEQSANNPKMRAIVDRQYKSALDSYTNDINKCCIPAGLICKFPQNNLQLMVQSGAKGSTVNTMQISCLLGQIELEGKRPPIMISGKSLPSFPSQEFSPRAGGFIDGRFMTGIQPQEFFFHCMAGREGLIDTAVKTSRSGYLQRCLIKHLEGLTVGYDLTVRDSDKSVIQFAYGEDSMDISKAQYLNQKQLKFLADNHAAIIDEKVIKQLKSEDDDNLSKHSLALQNWSEEHAEELKLKCKPPLPFALFSMKIAGKVKLNDATKIDPKTGRNKKSKFICELWQQSSEDIRDKFNKLCLHQPDPLVSKFQPDAHYGSINERLMDMVNSFKKSKECPKKLKKYMQDIISLKAMQSLCAPGEPVGLLAAQSIGEPSTQMTLNTFHFAGRGEMNVTLGIPRLREILMMASKNIKTPSMEVPFRNVPKLEAKAEKLRKVLTRVVVSDVLEKIDVEQELILTGNRVQRITLKFHFMPYKLYKHDYNVQPRKILKFMGDKFFKAMFSTLQKNSKTSVKMIWVEDEKQGRKRGTNNEDDDDEPEETNVKEKGDKNTAVNEEDSSDDEAPEDPEDAKKGNRYNQLIDDQEPEAEDDANDLLINEKDDEKVDDDEDGTGPELTNQEIKSIINTVLDSHEYAHDFIFDTENFEWCQLTFNIPIELKNIDLTTILRDTATKCVLWETTGIRRAIIYKNNDQLMLKTDGINLGEMFKYNHLLDLNKLYANDIHKIVETYGIEAGSKVIVREVRDVFKVYGITVDHRHLSLIADYMTYSGKFEPLNRKGMEDSPSPLHQLSFESSLTFLKTAATRGKTDKLENPSSCVMIGKPCNTGTGCFSLRHNLQSPQIF